MDFLKGDILYIYYMVYDKTIIKKVVHRCQAMIEVTLQFILLIEEPQTFVSNHYVKFSLHYTFPVIFSGTIGS